MSQKQRGAAWIEAPRTDVSVVTIVAGRRGHLARQLEGLQRQQRPADHLVIVRMDRLPVDVPAGVAGTVQVLDLPLPPDRLHLAAARNLGVRSTSGGTVVLLDVDCIPGAGLVSAYAGAAEAVDGLLCGGLRYLEPGQPSPGWSEPDLMKASAPHPARPVSGPGQLVRDDRHELAWTTSLAFRRESFDRICGFDERFQGYGGEDTDFAFRAPPASASGGVTTRWPTTSITRPRILRCSIWRTSSGMPRCLPSCTGGTRCRAGWRRSATAV